MDTAFNKILERSMGGVLRQLGKASAAESMAASTSVLLELGISARMEPVDGLMERKVGPEED